MTTKNLDNSLETRSLKQIFSVPIFSLDDFFLIIALKTLYDEYIENQFQRNAFEYIVRGWNNSRLELKVGLEQLRSK